MIKKLFILLILILVILSISLFKLNPLETVSLLSTYFVPTVFAIALFPFFKKVLPGRTYLYPVVKLFSFLVFGYSTWLIQYCFHVNGALFIYLIALSFLIYHLQRKISIDRFWIHETSGLFIFLLFLIICSFKPEISWGEKVMDISMLNYLYRQTEMIGEPWFSGLPLRYYYFGYYIFAKLLSIFKLHPLNGYFVCLCLIASSFFSITYSIMIFFNKKQFFAIFGAVFILFSSSTESFFSIFSSQKYDIGFFWNNTRVFKENLFAEFPFWSFLFGDFHPHVIAYPFLLLMILLTLDIQKFKGESFLRFFLMTFLGVNIAVINSWDVFFIAPFNVILILSLYWEDFFKEKKYHLILYPLLSSLLCLVLYLPLLKALTGASHGNTISIFNGEHNELINFFRHQGVQLLFIFILLLINIDHKNILLKKKNVCFLLTSQIAGSFLVFYFKMSLAISLCSFLLVLLFLMLNQKIFTSKKLLMPWMILLLLMYFVSEHFIIFDRINSLFKINNVTYILSSLIVLVLIDSILNHKTIKNISYGFLSLFILASGFNVIANASYTPTKRNLNSINGKSHLSELNPGDDKLINYINKNISGTPVLVEAFGKAYDYSAGRIQWYTGLSGFLVWSGQHLTQRGVPLIALKAKEKSINDLYGENSIITAYQICILNKIDYVVVGRLERSKYPSKGLSKFVSETDKFIPIFIDKLTNTILYKVKR
jgi:uncharacterized membrane protein